MNAKIELAGQRFGHLTVIKYSPRKTLHGGTYWICRCDCGRRVIVRSDNLRKGRTTKCSKCRNNTGKASVFIESGEVYGVV